MALDTSKPLQQAQIPAGTVLFEAGTTAGLLTILHKGEVIALNRLYKQGKRRMYRLGPNSVIGFGSLLSGGKHEVHYITATDCVISAFPVRGEFTKMILGKLNVGMMAVRSMLNEAMAVQHSVKAMASYLGGISKLIDNLAIAYFKCNAQPFEQAPESEDGPAVGDVIDPVVSAARVVVAEFQQSGGQIPEPITQIWLQGDHSSILKKSYEFESRFDLEEFNFLRRLLALPVNIQGAVYKADIKVLEGLCHKLNKIINGGVQELYGLHEGVDVAMESIVVGDYCYAEKFFLLSDLLSSGFTSVPISEFSTILKFVHQNAESLLKNYQQLQGVNFPNSSPAIEKIQSFLNSNEEVKQVEEAQAHTESVGADIEAIRKDLAGSAGKIMSFLQMPAEDTKAIVQNLKKFKTMQNPMDSGGDPRKLRRQIGQTYWKVYEKAYYKYKESRGNVPTAVKLMLRYGFFDEELLDDEHLGVLYNLEDTTRTSHPVVDVISWLDKVGNKEEPCSVDEMGMTYFEKLKNDNKQMGWKRESDLPEEYNTAEKRISYEIQNFLEVNTRLTSGTPTTAFPILTRYQITVPLERSFVTAERLGQEIDNVLAIDFSAFHREVIINDEERNIIKEFVQNQVIPNFIIVPSIGTKVMMWQDVSTRNKSSQGRLVVPVFATADLFTLVLEACAAFRWELTKTIMGADWNNVSQSSITADYTDYVQFFKKNRDLSSEVKEKLGAEFKRFRSDRDRFTNDYITWIKFESEGVLKMNKVARSIMYRHVPFATKIRENISTQPAFIDIHTRFKNIRNRKLKELENRYRKYGDDMPPELQENIDFYKV
ncbi:MAG: cyclic nucleotide-binding domain-containing protein [bacterium]|nr:cyclic nucleotide-binding domain-containing protein [bacterium]